MNTQLDLFGERKPPEATGNNKLIDYGIQNEKSDYRAHVGVQTEKVYLFPTTSGLAALKRNDLITKNAYQDGVNGQTAEGKLVPVSYIDGLQTISIPRDIFNQWAIRPGMSTSEKGLRATAIVVAMLKRNLIPLPVGVRVIDDDNALQIRGTDIIVNAKLHIQVKCDRPAGMKSDGGSGNLFLQTKECNPLRQY